MKQMTPPRREPYTRFELENKEGVTMTIYFGVDFHARQQFIKWSDTADGEIHQLQLSHPSLDEVRMFYSQFKGEVVVGLEASGYSNWFEAMPDELGHQVRAGDAMQIRRRARSRQKTDRKDAEPLLDLLMKGEFPRIHRLSQQSLEVLRQLRYPHRLVRVRTKVYNAVHSIPLAAGVSLRSKLRPRKGKQRLNELSLSRAHSQQREEWLSLIAELNKRIERVEKDLELAASSDERVKRVRTHPGIGLLTGLALVHTLCPVSRFPNSRKVTVTTYVGLEPRGYSSGEKQRLGGISKAGSRLLRFLPVEAGNKAVTEDEDLRKLYRRLLHRRDRARAKVAVARHVLIHAHIMLRGGIDYEEFLRRGVAVRSARTVHRTEVPDHLIERPASRQQ
jgi:transposase